MKNACAVVICALAALPAAADVTGPGGKTIDCYCTDQTGGRIELGEMICLHVDGMTFTAQCQMSLNVPMWRKIQDGCLSVRNLERGQPALDPGAVHTKI
ncbi:hypothetical protein [Marinibacterium sp. SX1]|uniref:hypothetical protein n=1 Tax=Marinibacterium sp. SX1 TaxID=3388424 RepID=UPI003D16AA52